DGEVYRNAGLGFDRLSGLQVRPETPLLDRLPGGSRKNRGSAENVEVLNIPVASNQSFEYDGALDFHLLGQQRIVRFHRPGQNLGGAGREMDASRGIGHAARIRRTGGGR